MLSDVQRWLIRSSAKTMRKEITGQVRRTLGGSGQRAGSNDVWDTATNEIPLGAGESPECQWCPICRAARRMRDSGPGLGGQLSGAGDAVASAVQDAIGALDSILGKASGGGQPRTGGSPRAGAPAGSGPGSAATRHDHGASTPDDARPGDAGEGGETADQHGSVAGDHGPGGWKPGDRLATAHLVDPDPWSGATEAADGVADDGQLGAAQPGDAQPGPAQPGAAQPGAAQPGTRSGGSPLGPHEAQLDGQGHEPDDRG
jgi:hypothetical protein